MTLVEELRSKKSRDNRGLLDRAADRIEELEAGYRRQSEGEWKMQEFPVTQCSQCGMRRNVETQVAWNFCPNCGVRMKGGAE